MNSFAIWISILPYFPLQLLPSVLQGQRDREETGYCRQGVCPIFPVPAVYCRLENRHLCLHNAL